MYNSLWPYELQHARLPCPPLSPRVCSNSRPLSQWYHPNISSSITPSPPALNFSQHQGLFQWVSSSSGGQSTGASASASVLPVNIQDWFPLGWTGWISLQAIVEYIMQNARLDEPQAGIKTAERNINNLICAYDTTLTAESKEELKSLLMKVKQEEWKSWLKTQYSES